MHRLCKCYDILFKGLEHLRILVSSVWAEGRGPHKVKKDGCIGTEDHREGGLLCFGSHPVTSFAYSLAHSLTAQLFVGCVNE